MPVHHDRDYAKQQGAPDMFMNILTTNGLLHALPHRLGRARGDGQEPGDPARRAVLSRRPAALHRQRHRQDRRRRRRGLRRGRRSRAPTASATTSSGTAIAQPARRSRAHEPARCRAPRRSSGSARPSSRRNPGAASCSSRARRSAPRSTTPAWRPPTSTAWSRSRWTPATRSRSPATSGIGDLSLFSRVHHGGGAAARHRDAGRDGGRDRRRRRRRLLPRVQRTVGHPVRRQRRARSRPKRRCSWRSTRRSGC